MASASASSAVGASAVTREQARPRGAARGRVDQVVGEGAVLAAPQTPVDARGRHAARTDVERVGDRAGEGMAHAHLPRRSAAGRQAQVAATVHGAAPVPLEPGREDVGRPSFGRTAQVELEAARTADHTGPRSTSTARQRAAGSGRAGRRGGADSSATRQRWRPARARGTPDSRRRGPPRGPSGRPARRSPAPRATAAPTAARSSGCRGHACARIGVQPRQVAARVKARQPALDLGEHRRHVDAAVGVADDPGHRAHRGEACRRARAASCRAVSALACRCQERRAQPCRRRRPAAGPRSDRDWTVSSSGGGGGGGSGRAARRADRRRRSNSPTPPTVATATTPRRVCEIMSTNARALRGPWRAWPTERSVRRTTRVGKLRSALGICHG